MSSTPSSAPGGMCAALFSASRSKYSTFAAMAMVRSLSQEVARPNVLRMVVQEGGPVLGGRAHAQFEQFPSDALSAP